MKRRVNISKINELNLIITESQLISGLGAAYVRYIYPNIYKDYYILVLSIQILIVFFR